MNFGATQFAGGNFMAKHTDGGQGRFEDGTEMGIVPESLRSLTISQLAKAQQQSQTGLGLNCDGRPIKQVSIVGVLTGKMANEMMYAMTVYDGTGMIEVRKFREDQVGDEEERMNALAENTYVRIYGSFKGEDPEAPNSLGYINAFSIRPVEDHNEVVHHQLDVIFQHMYLTQSQNAPAAANMGGAPAPFGGGFGMPGGGMAGGAPMGGNVLQPQSGGGQTAQDLVLSYIQERGGDGQGVHTESVVQGLSGQLPADAVRAAVHQLSTDGQVYSTVNEQTFAAV